MYVTSPVTNIDSQITFSENSNLFAPGSSSHEIVIQPGGSLFFAGDDANNIYEVLDGVVRTSKVLMDGRRQVLSFCYPGDLIGLSHDSLYHCDCDAVSRVRVRVYRKNAFMQDVTSDQEFCARLLRNAAAEVNHMQDHFLMLGRKTAMEKLASFLVAVMDRQTVSSDEASTFELPMKRSDIADFLGMTIETVSRNLTKLRKIEVIDLPNPQQVKVLNQHKLRNLAENDA